MKKITSIFLCFLMLLSAISFQVFADEAEGAVQGDTAEGLTNEWYGGLNLVITEDGVDEAVITEDVLAVLEKYLALRELSFNNPEGKANFDIFLNEAEAEKLFAERKSKAAQPTTASEPSSANHRKNLLSAAAVSVLISPATNVTTNTTPTLQTEIIPMLTPPPLTKKSHNALKNIKKPPAFLFPKRRFLNLLQLYFFARAQIIQPFCQNPFARYSLRRIRVKLKLSSILLL